MAKVSVTYNAPEGDSEVVHTHGLKFFSGHPVELDEDEHEAFLKKAKGNRHFLVGDQAAEDPFRQPGAKPIDEMGIDELRAEADKRGISHEGVSKPDLKKLLKQP